MATRKFGRYFGLAAWMAPLGVIAGLGPAPAALADPESGHALVVRTADLAALNFGDAIGVIAESSAAAGIAALLGAPSDVADVARFEDLEDARAALDLGAVDSLYLARPEAERLSQEPALAVFEIPTQGQPKAPEADMIALNSAPADENDG